MSDKHIDEAGYYHAQAADMMAKAQAAPSKAVRAAYLNLARTWARKAAHLDKKGPQLPAPDMDADPPPTGAGQKN